MSLAAAGNTFTDDALLDGRVRLRQPAAGFRTSADAVLLAAACGAPKDSRVLDAGCGAGAVMLCLAWRRPDLDVTGLEIDESLTALCAYNINTNGFGARAQCVTGNLAAPDAPGGGEWPGGELFDAVVSNPPFHKHGAARPSPDAARARALHEDPAFGLAAWTGACMDRLKPGGALTMIIAAGREAEVAAALRGRAHDTAATPVRPRDDAPAKRVIISARMGTGAADGAGATGAADITQRTPLTLHEADGADTPAARAILRDGLALGHLE
ncbi:MAG: tRNA1(Val) (adenine(37)-N6)-methyltransferase [Rhodospirillales bacterium]